MKKGIDGWILFITIVLIAMGIFFVADSGLVQRLNAMSKKNFYVPGTLWQIKLIAVVFTAGLCMALSRLNEVRGVRVGAGTKNALIFCVVGLGFLMCNFGQKKGFLDDAYTQTVSALLGGIAMALIVNLPREFLLRKAKAFFWLVLFLLVIVLIPHVGKEVNGARSWFDLGGFSLQPSEFAKPAVALFLAYIFTVVRDWVGGDRKFKVFGRRVPYVWYPISLIALTVLLIVAEPDNGTALTILLPAAAMFLMGGLRLNKLLLGAIIIGLIAGIFCLNYANPDSLPLPRYIRNRVKAYQNPFAKEVKYNEGGQARSALMALSRGGLTGVGLMKGDIKRILPECHNDYIFTTVAEETGFVGSCFLLFLYGVLIFRGFYLGARCKNAFSKHLLTGCATFFAAQMFINLAGVTNLIPATGIPLPFMSYGGSALIAAMIMSALMLHATKYINFYE